MGITVGVWGMLPFTKLIQKNLEDMTVGDYFTIPLEELGPDLKAALNNIRAQVSRANAFADLNWKVHKGADAVWIWFDPTPKPKVRQISPAFDRLIQLHKQHRAAEAAGDIDTAQGLARDIANCIGDLQDAKQPTAPKQKGAITMPLDAVLKHIGVSQAIWDLLDGKEKLARRIKAELEMRAIRQSKKGTAQG